MAQQKKKKQGGQTGRPAFSEPRVQVFSKFNGCNFQLATRNFDNIFEQDAEAQTDLMPMYMAVQNNAGIVPMGGIETRQNMAMIVRAPEGQRLNGVVTLVGNTLYAACDNNRVYHATLPEDGSSTELDNEVTITDLDQGMSDAVWHTYDSNGGS